MKQYLDLLDEILTNGIYKPNRTGIGAYTIAGAIFKHDMSKGFPILTTKKMPFKTIAVELEFFIKGYTDKRWLQERKCYIWDEWCNPEKLEERMKNITLEEYPKIISEILEDKSTSPKLVDKIKSEDTLNKIKNALNNKKEKKAPIDNTLEKSIREILQMHERDLGPIYGWQWRHFGAKYEGYDKDYTAQGLDQLSNIVNKLKTNPNDRRMIVTAWNPLDLKKMALPACHYGFQVTVIGDKINLLWNQRSVDTILGLPFNITSYGLLLHLLSKETGLKEGTLTGFLSDVHIYENHVEKAKEQLSRDPDKYPLPKIKTKNFTHIFDWNYTDSELINYLSYPKIDFGKVAV
ncbi:MAG: thymidylate synthase [Candidatus Woesearchaeota archaeon]|nr:MAG: thymidylate synthase [Candidatus Woesearchaeota archaeon]